MKRLVKNIKDIEQFIEKHNKFLIIQADNPDGDSISSALALDEILNNLGKYSTLYCAVEVPSYLKFISGWEKINNYIPAEFDASIIVDTSSSTLLENLYLSPEVSWVKSKPCIVLDHHKDVECDIDFASIVSNNPDYASTGELIHAIAKELKIPLNQLSGELILQSILSDSLGLTSDIAGPETYKTVADLLELGISRADLEEKRRKLSKMSEAVFRYKAELMERTEFFFDTKIALTVIPESELYDIGTQYNPGPLIMSELLNIEGVQIALAIKRYKNRVTVALRCAQGTEIAGEIASSYGGGGHPYAAGFRIDNFDQDFTKFKYELVNKILDKLN
jgi:phosphoesterase RecJ-like protein